MPCFWTVIEERSESIAGWVTSFATAALPRARKFCSVYFRRRSYSSYLILSGESLLFFRDCSDDSMRFNDCNSSTRDDEMEIGSLSSSKSSRCWSKLLCNVIARLNSTRGLIKYLKLVCVLQMRLCSRSLYLLEHLSRNRNYIILTIVGLKFDLEIWLEHSEHRPVASAFCFTSSRTPLVMTNTRSRVCQEIWKYNYYCLSLRDKRFLPRSLNFPVHIHTEHVKHVCIWWSRHLPSTCRSIK